MDSAAPLRPQSIDLTAADTVERLAVALGVDTELFRFICQQQPPYPLYIRHEIPKRSSNKPGESRIVWEALGIAAQAHKSAARRTEIFFREKAPGFPHKAAYGYVRGRSTRENAKQHCKSRLLLRADIKDFFPSISKDRLAAIFLRTGIPQDSANALSNFFTVDGRLPLGLHASPVLANLVCVPLDQNLEKLAEKYQCVYTRYADDMSISGNGELPSKTEIRDLLAREEFELSERKFRISTRGQAQYVTGLSVSDGKPRAPREMKRRLRQELYYASRFGLTDHLERIGEEKVQRGVNRLDGTVNYVTGIEKADGEHFRHAWQTLLRESGQQSTYLSRNRENREISVFVDETEFSIGGQPYLAIALARSEERARLTDAIENIKQDYLADPFSKGVKEMVQKRGVHYTDAHPDLRKALFDILPSLPFSACISFQKLQGHSEYRRTYLDIFARMLRQTLITSDGATVTFLVEKNQKVKTSDLNQISSSLFDELLVLDARRPRERPTVVAVTKLEEPCISVPDFLLAAFAAYAIANARTSADAHRFLEFERIRDKIRYVENGDLGAFFTRKRPFHPLK